MPAVPLPNSCALLQHSCCMLLVWWSVTKFHPTCLVCQSLLRNLHLCSGLLHRVGRRSVEGRVKGHTTAIPITCTGTPKVGNLTAEPGISTVLDTTGITSTKQQ
jgi:hypothetical protein